MKLYVKLVILVLFLAFVVSLGLAWKYYGLYDVKAFDYRELADVNGICQLKAGMYEKLSKLKEEHECVQLSNPVSMWCGKVLEKKRDNCVRDGKVISCSLRIKIEP